MDIANKMKEKRIFYKRNRRINRNPSTLELHTKTSLYAYEEVSIINVVKNK